ncbi:MAG TPA: hypothetical protein P5121_13090 [Caldilineaceae bacterium]|nr:hypothetical protein [Caldilineaceae bacterium]
MSTPPSTTTTEGTATSTVLTRSAFYALAEYCRDYALELAAHDQTRVNLQQCHQFNQWFRQVRNYPELASSLRSLKSARPIARWQVMTLAAVCGVVLFFALGSRFPRLTHLFFVSGYFFLLIGLYFVPERLYGTTVEQIEGKVLRVVDTLETLLMSGSMEFTEAAFFQVKENLQVARRELRQQIDLAHRRWR